MRPSGQQRALVEYVYSATKAAVRSFGCDMDNGLEDRRILVNAVSPGSIDTPD